MSYDPVIVDAVIDIPFVFDGSDGGYARAPVELKEQVKQFKKQN